MKIAIDTNLLVRVRTEDDQQQSAIARAELERADLVALATPALCELVWVLSSGYKKAPDVIARALRALIQVDKVAIDRGAMNAQGGAARLL